MSFFTTMHPLPAMIREIPQTIRDERSADMNVIGRKGCHCHRRGIWNRQESCRKFYAREGANVIVADMDERGGMETVDSIKRKDGQAVFIKTDVSNPQECEGMVNAARKQFGRLDLACNNAGIGGEQNLTADYSIEGWQKTIAINLSGVFYCMKYEIPAMLESEGGSIINMASILGKVGFTGAPAYVSAKHGMIGLTKMPLWNTATRAFASMRSDRVSSILP
jgi:enoyl-[acyl-carrier-protein] reductase (NADH)